MWVLLADLGALLIVAYLGYNCIKRVNRIIKDDEQKRISKRGTGVQPHDDE